MHESNFRDKIAVILVKIFCELKNFLVSRIPRYTIISTSGLAPACLHYSHFRDKKTVILVKIFCEHKNFLVFRIPRYTIISTSDNREGVLCVGGHNQRKNTAKQNLPSAVCASSMYSRLCMNMFVCACAMPHVLYL